MRWLISVLLAAPTMAQDGGPPKSLPPPVPVALKFDLKLTPRSPLLSFDNSTVSMPASSGFSNWNQEYRLAPRSIMQAPVLGSGLLVEGTPSPDYDGWLTFDYGDAKRSEVGRAPEPPLLNDSDVDGLRRSDLRSGGGTSCPGGQNTACVGTVDISTVTIRTGMNSSAPSILQVPTAFLPFAYNNMARNQAERNPFWTYEGNWSIQTTLPSGAVYRTVVGEQNATIRIQVVPGSAFLVVNGTAGPEYGVLAAELEPQPLFVLGSVNASRPFTASCQPMYYAALDGGTNYTLTLRAEGRSGLHSITFYAADKDVDSRSEFTTKEAYEFPGFAYDEAASRLEPPGRPDESEARRTAASLLFIAGAAVAAALW